jgi:two-component system cell cycle sensor histidine kinase/response regulator CckA
MSDLTFSQLVDIGQIRRLLEAQYKITGTPTAILDSDEKILAATGWQDICVRYHRVHPDARARCLESDAYIKAHLRDFNGGFLDYRCRNGLWDVAVPITINGKHMATFFIGQFFYDDDMPDPEFFRNQADLYGFDRDEYLAALARVPIYSREHIRNIMDYYRNLVEVLTDLGMKNLLLTKGIAGRKKTEEALQNSEIMLRKVFESIPDLLLVIDRDFRILKSNWHGGYDYIDGTVRDKSPHCYETFYPGRPSPCKSCPAKEVFETGKAVTVEKFSPKTRQQLEIRAFPIFDESGNVSMVAEHVRDVTAQKKARQSLVDSEKKYRSLFEAMQEGFALHEVVYDETGKPVDYRFLDVNPAFEKSTGYHRSLVTGKTIHELMPDSELRWIDEFGRTALTGEPRHFEKYSEKWGRHFEVNTYSPQPGQLAAIFVDLTERRRLQEELVKGQKLESLGILAGGIAHDFNNILAGILGNLSVARMVLPDDHKALERIFRCEKAIQQATCLTQQLLTFSRGGSPLKKVLNLRHIIEESALFALRGSNVTNELDIADDLWLIEADEGQITQVINNLLINADQSMPGGGVVLIEAGNLLLEKDEVSSLESGRYVRVRVVDHGKGIPPKYLDKIFDPYFTTKESGTGLGLTSLYSIVKKHDGQVLVSSRVGRGTVFEIYLPACPECVESGKTEPHSSADSGEGYIFVMDDEMMIREVAEEMIGILGYRVETFSSGEEVVDRYKASLESGNPPDAVIMDLTIPGKMGGLEAASLISAMDRSAALIVSSGYSNDPVMANYQVYGFTDVLLKPFSIDSLGNSLKRLLDGKRQVEDKPAAGS